MSKWSIYLNMTEYCVSERGTGNRPCDMGSCCDKCMYDKALTDKFKAIEDTIDESQFCTVCGHPIDNDISSICSVCEDYDF